MSAEYDVLVAGAGPVGLTLAGLLARLGLRCLAIDRAAVRTDKSKALVMWPRTLELLQSVGAVQPFLAAGTPAYRGRVFSHGRPLAQLDLSRSGSVFASALMIPQSESERLLEADALAAGVELARQTELLRFSPAAEGVRVVLRAADGSERERSCAWLVGCDGAHSTVRHGLGLDFAGTAENADWFLADVHVAGGLARDEVSIHLHPEGVLAIFPIPPDRFRLIGDIGPSRGEHPPEPTMADVQSLLDRRGPSGLTAHDPVWLSGFRINDRQVPTYRVGRVVLAGDAAHIHSPAGGQGMNTGMHDAFNLAWKLALTQQGRAKSALLDSYQAERHPVGAMIVRGAGALTRMGTLRNPLARGLRDAVIRALLRIPAAQDAVVSVLTETAIRYRQSPLVRDERAAVPRRGVRAGDRMPDLALRDGSLHARLRGGRHALLVPGGGNGVAAAVAAAFPDLCDVHEIGADVFGAEVVAVVRPDTYLGYLGPARAENVLAHLESYLVRSAAA
ncbi:MAG TPA: FAD-dependent monooxygenase [Candidatus Dormibacteraeota bacterium]|nr:FAD-dependent monooxygenase [Candidatus Dormibacteraeota bacterium]